MSKKRQAAAFDRLSAGNAAIMTLARDYSAGSVIPRHDHNRDQLVFASRGVMTVRTADGAWIVPPLRAVWIPERIPHSIAMSGNVSMRTLYLRPRLAASLPRQCCVVNVPALLRELILHACVQPSLRANLIRDRHLIDVILDRLRDMHIAPLHVPLLNDPRAARVAEQLLADPSSRRTLAQLCRTCGGSRRTIERLFAQETGMTFGRWRQQVRLMQGLRLLAEGSKVTHAALEAGYSTPSAFIAAFRAALGDTPAQYFKDSAARSPVPPVARPSR